MSYYQVFDDLPPIQLNSLRYTTVPDDDLWLGQGDFGPSYHGNPNFTWGEHQSHLIYSREYFPTEITNMSTLGLYARETRDDPFVPSQVQDYYRRDIVGLGLAYDSNEVQPYPFSPSSPYCQRQASPMETVRSCSSGFGDSWVNTGCAASDYDSIGSPGPLSPPNELARNISGFFVQKDTTDSWGTDPCCALREIQQFPDEDSERFTRPLHEAEFNLNEITLKEKPVYPVSITTKSNDDLHEIEAQREPTNGSRVRSRDTSEDTNDSDYQPAQAEGRGSRAPNGNHQARSLTGSKVSKRASPKSSVTHSGKEKQQILATLISVTQKAPSLSSRNSSRPFSCPLAPYGCHITFTSKNEWKRHITSRHVQLGIWRCDLCPDSDTRPNEFNRKDLFTQHLRRMHHPNRDEINNGISNHLPASNKKAPVNKKPKLERGNSQDDDISDKNFENSLPGIRSRCWVQIRDPPMKASCAFCEKVFEGSNSFEDWLEHTGKHLSDLTKQRPKNVSQTVGVTETWRKDKVFREWLSERGFLRAGHEPDTWILVEDATLRDLNL